MWLLSPQNKHGCLLPGVYSCLHRAWQFDIGGDLVVQWLVGPDHQHRVVENWSMGELSNSRFEIQSGHSALPYLAHLSLSYPIEQNDGASFHV